MSPSYVDTPEDLEALAVAAAAGIHKIALGTPFGIGDVNTYLIEDDPLTLVDCGPNSASVLLELEARLADRGHRLEDLGLLVITHQHIDHVGLAGAIHARTGVPVACLDGLAPVLEDWETHATQDDDDAREIMRRHGVEDHVADALRAVADIIRGWSTSVPVARGLRDGGTLRLRDRELTIHHRPGHSPSDILLDDAAAGVTIAGDHLIAGVSSNAIIQRPLGAWDGMRPHTLVTYRESLRATRGLGDRILLGGHRGPVTNHRELIDERLAGQERRAEQFLELLADGPLSAHDVAFARWGELAFTQAFLTISEVLGHLDLLAEEGRVLEDRSEQIIRFSAA